MPLKYAQTSQLVEPAERSSERRSPSIFPFRRGQQETTATAQTIALNRAMSTARGCRDDLRKFRQAWSIGDRAAIYPKSHILHFSVLAALILFEGMANAYFFSTGSDLGLLGGWLQAITVSFTNVIAAFFLIGFIGMRQLSNFRPGASWKQLTAGSLGLAGIVVTAIALFALNLSAAHYRDLLELNAATLALGGSETTGEVLAPVVAAQIDPFGFQTLEALLLLILGVTFAAIAAYKGRTFDDVIPGYGGVTRRLEKAADTLELTLTPKHNSALPPELVEQALKLHAEICEELAGPAKPLDNDDTRNDTAQAAAAE